MHFPGIVLQEQEFVAAEFGSKRQIRGKSFPEPSPLARRASLCFLALLSLVPALLLSGCGKFFPPLSSTSGSGSDTSSVGDYLYIGNTGTNPLSIAGFSVASTGLSAISGSNWSVSLYPTALAITPNDDYLYMGSEYGDIYVYTIGSTGALTLGNGGAPVATSISPAVLRVDPTGKYLLGADSSAGEAYVFSIGSGGVLTSVTNPVILNATVANATVLAPDLEITPSGSYVFVSYGTAGIYTMSFNTTTGALAQVNGVLNPKQSGDADYGMAIAPSGSYLFAAETGIGAVRVFSISSSGVLTEASGSPYTTGTGPHAVLVDSTGSYVYVANSADGTISAFLLSGTGALTTVSGSPFSTGKLPSVMVEDKTDSYIAVLNTGGSPDLQIFKFSTTTAGALTSFATATTGADPTEAASLAATY